MGNIWVATLYVSPEVAQKIISIHEIDPQEVEDAVVCQLALPFAWNDHPTRGRRALVKPFIRGRRALVVLYPANLADPDEWNLGSAHFIDGVAPRR